GPMASLVKVKTLLAPLVLGRSHFAGDTVIERSLQHKGKESCTLMLQIAVSSAAAAPSTSPPASNTSLPASNTPLPASSTPLPAPSNPLPVSSTLPPTCNSVASPSNPVIAASSYTGIPSDPSVAGASSPSSASSSTTALINRAITPLAEVHAQQSKPGPVTKSADAISATADTINSLSQSDIVGSLQTVVSKLDVLVKIGDEIAKVHDQCSLRRTALIVSQIHPWASLAWSVLSVGLKVIMPSSTREFSLTSCGSS
ncbi:hypothetical protein HWV62_7980, partial [Athelia sp. TMB]